MHRFRSRFLTAAAAVAILGPLLAACGSGPVNSGPTGTDISNKQQAQDFTHLVFTEPVPGFPYSVIRQNLIEIEAIEALGIDSTTFFFVQGIDHPVFSCASVGVPMPVTDSITNNTQAIWKQIGDGHGGRILGGAVLDQEDPNGIFQGISDGTDTLCLNGQGKEFAGYNEAIDISVTAPAHWDKSTGTIVLDGEPVYPVCRVIVQSVKKQKATEVCTLPPNQDKAHIKVPPTVAPKAPASAPAASPTASAGTSAKISYSFAGIKNGRAGFRLAA